MKKLLLLLALSLCMMQAGAQATLGIGAGRQIFSLQDTVNFNDSDSYYVWVKNKGNAVYSGTVFMNISVDSTGTGNSFVPLSTDSLQMVLQPGDSIPWTKTVTYSTGAPYRMGGNIVVIWPSGGCLTVDSTRDTTVYILGYAGIQDLSSLNMLRLAPNPTVDEVRFLTENNKPLYRARIYDLQGHLLGTYLNISAISLKGFSAGPYFIFAEAEEGKGRGYEIIKRE